MPLPSPSPLAPYDTVDSCLNLVRSKMLDTIGSLAGDILTDAQPFMQEYTNAGWRELQLFLAGLGYSRLKQPFFGWAYPVVANTDPALYTQLTWSAFINTDGTNYAPPYVNVLPQNMILPLRVSERISSLSPVPDGGIGYGEGPYGGPPGYGGAPATISGGGAGTQRFSPMQMAKDELPQTSKGPYNGWWLWETDTLYMPGSIYSMDLRMELAIYLEDFLTSPDETIQWYQRPVPIMRAKTALAYFIADEVVQAREDLAGSFTEKAQQAARQIYNIEVSQKQRVPTQRRPYCGNRGNGYGTQVW